MTYKVLIAGAKYTCSYGNKALFEYAGVSVKDLKGQMCIFAFPKVAAAVVGMHDPRFNREFLLREQGQGDLEDAQKFMIWIMQACSRDPGAVIDVKFIKETGFKNPEGV